MGKSLKAHNHLDLFRELDLFEEGEEYVNGFSAQAPKVFGSRLYGWESLLAVLSNQRLFLAHYSGFTITKVDAFQYSQIERATLRRGIQACDIGLHLESGRSVHLRALRHCLVGYQFDEEVEKYFLLRIPTKVTGDSHQMACRTPFRNLLALLERCARGIYYGASICRDVRASSKSESEFSKNLRSLDRSINLDRKFSTVVLYLVGVGAILVWCGFWGHVVADVIERIIDFRDAHSSKMGTSLRDLIDSDPRLFLVLAVGLVPSILILFFGGIFACFALIFGGQILSGVTAAHRRMSLMVEALASQTESGDPAGSRDERHTVYRRPETG